VLGRGIRFVINRWWRRFPWLVRFGWMNLRGRAFGDPGLGMGLIVAGLLVKRSRSKTRTRTRIFVVRPPESMSVSVRRMYP